LSENLTDTVRTVVEDCFRSILNDLVSLQVASLTAPLPDAPAHKIEKYPHMDTYGECDENSGSGEVRREPADAAGTPIDDPNSAHQAAVFPGHAVDGVSTPVVALADLGIQHPTARGGLAYPNQDPPYYLRHDGQLAAGVFQNFGHQTHLSYTYNSLGDDSIDGLGAAPSTSTMDHCFDEQFSSLNNHEPHQTAGSQDESMLNLPGIGEELGFSPTDFQISNPDAFRNSSPGNGSSQFKGWDGFN
jgi:hypothetical protein